jgi:hypothetical protein
MPAVTIAGPSHSFASTPTYRTVDLRSDCILYGIAPDRKPPKYSVGTWVYDWFHQANVQVLSHHFDARSVWGWQAHTAGHGDWEDNLCPAQEGKPWKLYAPSGPGRSSWVHVGTFESKPDDLMPDERPIHNLAS